ncbi:MAG TPA: tail fiber domain-containing protein [Verrucomicrobiae bacterium]|jgi:hypothetical protein|nr:tail fiber domain-containing protein [Verrucomicrobiae bacterium]
MRNIILRYGLAACVAPLFLLTAPPAPAQLVPALINYQGRISNPDGSTLATGNYALSFTIYDAATGGTVVWGPQIFDGQSGAGHGPLIPVVQGYFNLPLGPKDILGSSLSNAFNASNRFVELTVTNHAPVTPRQQFLTAPFAFQAAATATVGGQAAANVASATIAVNGATSANQPGSIVRRDQSGNITLNNLTLQGPLTLASPATITAGGLTVFHSDYANQNMFVGPEAGNAASTGFGGNTALGVFALTDNTSGSYNTATGALALNSNLDGSSDTALGNTALQFNTSGANNTATGVSALYFNTSGGQNTASGVNALFNNVSGSLNSAFGVAALQINTNGTGNTAVGAFALDANQADYNVAIGYAALTANTSGSANTAVGNGAASQVTVGINNTAIGNSALQANVVGNNNTAVGSGALSGATGANNIALGKSAGSNLGNGSANIYIGNAGGSSESGATRIGTSGSQVTAFMAGIAGVTIGSGTAVFINASTGQLGTINSSARFKENIKNMDTASDALLGLRPVSFRYKPDLDPQGTPQFGLIAEEVEKVNPDLVVRDAQNRPLTVRYEAINAMLLNEFLKEHHKVQEQAAEIDGLKERLDALEKAWRTGVQPAPQSNKSQP